MMQQRVRNRQLSNLARRLRNQKLADLVSVLTMLIAALALYFAWIQINAANETQREATAQNVYSEYLKLAIEHPALADGSLPSTADAKDLSKYEWFVSYFLNSAEQIHQTSPESAEWRATIKDQACHHRTLLQTEKYQKEILKSHYSNEFQALLSEALSECRQ